MDFGPSAEHLLKSNKIKVTIGSSILLFLGFLYLFIGFNYFYHQLLWAWIPIVVLFISAGFSGIFGAQNEKKFLLRVHELIMYIIGIIYLALFGFSAVCLLWLIVNPIDCSTSANGPCYLSNSLETFIEIIFTLGAITSAGSIGLLVVLIKNVRACIRGMDQFDQHSYSRLQ